MLRWTGLFILFFSLQGWSQLTMKKLVELPDKMYETSGLVFYQERYLLTHNDGGNDPELFVLDIKAGTQRSIIIEGVKNNDWEDLTVDDDGRVYIGAFGNNLNKREKCFVYVLPKNFLEKDKVEPKKIEFTYEDQIKFPPSKKEMNFDCEAFFWANDSLYFFTKCRTEPYTGITNIYVLPDKSGDYKAKKIGSIQLCSSDWRFCSVTAADYSEKYKKLVLLTYSRLCIIDGFTGHQFWNGNVKSYQLNLVRQREAICFKSKNSWYMTDEYKKGLGGGNLYEIKLKE